MRPQVKSNLNDLSVDVEYLLSCQRTPCDPVTNPNEGAIFFVAGTSAANEYGITTEAGRIMSGLPAGTTLQFTQTHNDTGFQYGGVMTGVSHTFIGYTPAIPPVDENDPGTPAVYVDALWQATDERGLILAQGTTSYDPDTLILTLTPVYGNGPRWAVNTMATVEIFQQS